jgi:uncharacterized HAD superfamily protein
MMAQKTSVSLRRDSTVLPLLGHRYQIDWDSTINDFDRHFVNTLNDTFGTNHSVSDMTSWDWVRGHGDYETEYMWGIKVFGSMEWNMAIPPKVGSVLAVNRLIDAGAKVDVVTARPHHHKPWLREWLDAQGLHRARAYVNQHKSVHAEKYGVTAAVDDSPLAVEHLRQVVPVYLIDMPYNQYVPISEKWFPVVRVPSLWLAVEDIFESAKDSPYRQDAFREI